MGIANKNSIVFFGSGPVAAASLALLLDDFEIEAIITKPSTQHEMQAVAPDAPLFTASNKQQLGELFDEKKFVSPMGILIDFGIIVSQNIIDHFPRGIINSHFSLLPEWRGADPITFSILSGQKQTGVSLMLLVEAMDEGPLISFGVYDMPEAVTAQKLTYDLIDLSRALLVGVIPEYLEGNIVARSQEVVAEMMPYTPQVSYSRKLTKQDRVIDWNKSAEQIEREIRAFEIWPKSVTKLGSLDVVITSSEVSNKQIQQPGSILIEQKKLYVGCGEKSLEILSLKPVGKKEMPASAFLAGYKNRITPDLA